MAKENTIKTTLGDLIFTLTEETYLLVHDEEVAYRVVAHLLSHLLRVSPRRLLSNNCELSS